LLDTFQQCIEEVEGLAADAEVPNIPNTPHKHALTSEFEIESRPGMRSTKVSQKLRQEKDRANMTIEDEEYTKIVIAINDILKELFLYDLELHISRIDICLHKLMFPYTRPSISILQKFMVMYVSDLLC